MRRSAVLAVPLSIAVLSLPAWAAAQPSQGTTTGTTTPAAGSTTTTVPTYTGRPRLSRLTMRATVKSQQGHARFMLGMRTAGPATITITLTNLKDKKVVRTITSAKDRAQGAAWFLVQAVNDQGYQLPNGRYRATVRATDSRGRKSNTLRRNFRLQLTPPRGRIDGFTVPNLDAIARQLRIPAGGQLVVALAPKGILVTAGLRRGDVITKVNDLEVTTPGQWAAALKALPADTPMTIEFRRGAEVRTGTIQLPPDWNPSPDYAKVFATILRREKSPKLGYLLASVRNRIDVGKADQAQALLDKWPRGLRATAVGHMAQGEILLARDDLNGALESCEKAAQKDPNLAPALLCQGLTLSRLDRTADAVPVFQAAVTADPGSAVAQAFLAYALISANQYEPAIAAATQASALDPRYEDGPIALGLALIGSGQKARGVAHLKKGLLFMSDQKRADQLIAENLDPNA